MKLNLQAFMIFMKMKLIDLIKINSGFEDETFGNLYIQEELKLLKESIKI